MKTYTDFNTVTVSGNLTKNSTVTTVDTPYGKTTKTIFCIANNGANGKVNWINVQALGRIADIAKDLAKGQRVTVVGKLNTSKNATTGITYTFIKPYQINVPVEFHSDAEDTMLE